MRCAKTLKANIVWRHFYLTSLIIFKREFLSLICTPFLNLASKLLNQASVSFLSLCFFFKIFAWRFNLAFFDSCLIHAMLYFSCHKSLSMRGKFLSIIFRSVLTLIYCKGQIRHVQTVLGPKRKPTPLTKVNYHNPTCFYEHGENFRVKYSLLIFFCFQVTAMSHHKRHTESSSR